MKRIIIVPFIILSNAILAASFETFNMSAEAQNTIGQVGNVSYVTTLHHAGVRNTTDTKQTFTVTYTICAKSCDSSHHYRITLNPHGEWQDGFILHLTPLYQWRGHYQIVAKTQVTGNELNQETTGYGDIQIN